MFYSHQILARKRPLGQIWMAATLHAKINRKKLDKLDIIQICEEILNPSVPMALRLSGILMGGVVIVYERKVKQLLDDAVRLQVEISGAFRTKAVVRDPTLLSKRKNRARKEAVTLPENANDEAEFGDFELPSIPKFPNYQTYISMRLDEVNDYPEPEDIGPDIHQADPADITLFDFHGSFQTNTETYDRFERFDIEGDDDLMNLDPQGAQIPSTLVPSPPRHYDIPEVVHTSPHPRPDPEEQEQVRNVFAEQMEEQNIPIREEQDVPRPTKRKARKTNTLQMDYEQTMISGPEYQSLLQDASDILCKGGKRKVRGTTTTAMKISKLMDMPPIVLCHHQRDKEHVDNFYPPQLYELWCKITQPLQTSASADNQRPDFFEEPSTGFVQEEMQDNYQADHGSEINAQNLGASAEALRAALSGKGVSVEGLMAEPQARPENSNRQAADISVTPFYSGDDVRSLPSTPTARVAASSNTEINSKRVNRQRPHSSPRRGLEPVEEDRPVEHPVEHRDFDFDFTMAPENGLNADTELQAETGPTQTQKLLSNPAEEKKTESIKNHLKAHFETPGNPQVESLNKLTLGMNKNAAAQLFYQSCVLATRGDIRVKQAQPYGDILIERGPKM